MATERKKVQSKAAGTPMSAEAVAQRAYEIFLARGGPDGHDGGGWLQGELGRTRKRRQARAGESGVS